MKVPIQSLLHPRAEHRLLGGMLLLLHMGLWWDFSSAVSRSMVLAHLGLFLAWQPVWNRAQHLNWGGLATFLLLTLGFTVWLDWWLMGFWLVLLLGLVGGRVTTRRTDRNAGMVAGSFLLFELLLGVVPHMFDVPSISDEIAQPLAYGLLLFPLSLLFFPSGEYIPSRDRAIDFIHGLTVALLVLIMVLGTLVSMYRFGTPYPVALFQAVLGIAVFLIGISWVWTPFAGFGGLGQLWTKYLLNVGTPFEEWLSDVSMLAADRQTPGQFITAAVGRLVRLPWVEGGEWSTPEGTGLSGRRSPHVLDLEVRDLEMKIYTGSPVTTALRLHGQLLVRLIGDFYQAKLREQELSERAHVEAVYETGARVTHDIKNLLQSLYAITGAVQSQIDRNPEEVHRLVERQLPLLTQRLQLALDKLQAPSESTPTMVRVGDWWETFRNRHDGADITFRAELGGGGSIPVELFDSVVENLLENARFKRQSEPDLNIEVSFRSQPGGVTLRVADSGSPIPIEFLNRLFRGPVRSQAGLGIGLYQAARHAEELGFRLQLTANEPALVEFELSGPASPEPTIKSNATPSLAVPAKNALGEGPP